MLRRAGSVLVSTIAVTALTLVAAQAASGSGTKYVALGDSYSSGLGAGDESGGCERSPNAYPALWAQAHSPSSFVSVACSGAKTTDVAAKQISALTTSTTLVSITVGGNDENFAGIMETCNLGSDSSCVSTIQASENDARAHLPGKLAALYGKISAAAPHAEVVVLDYPRFYDLAHNCFGLSQTKRAKIDEGINLLDNITARAAAKAGFRFAEVRAAYTGHEICDSNRWLHSVDFFDLDESYHPTASGQSQGYLPVFTDAA